MKKKINLKNKSKKRIITKGNMLLLTVIFVTISVYLFLNNINNKFTPILLENAELEIDKFSTIIVNKAISQVLEDKINVDEIFETIKNDDGIIQTIDFNPIIVNQILNIATTVVQNNLKLLEDGKLDAIGIYDMDLPEERLKDLEQGIIIRLPIGVLTDNTILSNLGPEIPVKLNYIGDVNSNITTKVTQYGINNAMIEIGVHLEMTAQIILPFVTERKKLHYDIPITIKIIQGSVPNYYGSGLLKDSSLYTIPFDN